MKPARPALFGDAEFRRFLSSPAHRREIAESYVAHAERGLSYLGWQAAIARAYPEHVHPHGTAIRVAAEVARSLALAEAILSPRSSRTEPKKHRARPARPGAISPQGTATIPANACRAGSAQTVRIQTVAQVSRPRTCV